jgi:hypothetical protein
MSVKPDALGAHIRAGWTWRGPTPVGDPDHPDYYEMRIQELPDFFLASTTKDDLYAELRPALRAFFESYTERGESLPALPHKWIVSLMALVRRPHALYRVVSPERAKSGVEGLQFANASDEDSTSV